MTTHFSRKLSELNLYVREGRNVIFSNGMKMAELAATMDEVGVHPNVVSEVVKGKARRGYFRTFLPDQFDLFCKLLNLPRVTRWQLENALVQDRFKKSLLEGYYEDWEYGRLENLAEGVVEDIEEAVEVSLTDLAHVDFYSALTRRSILIVSNDDLLDRLSIVIPWLLRVDDEGRSSKALLLVKLGVVAPHLFDAYGEYALRIDLGQATFRHAMEVGLYRLGGWTLVDGVGWPLIEQYNMLTQARVYLKQVRDLAESGTGVREYGEMRALATIFLAKTYLIEGDIESAQTLISSVPTIDLSPVIEVRYNRVAGAIQLKQQQFDKALAAFRRAEEAYSEYQPQDQAIFDRIHVGQVQLELNEYQLAREQFEFALAQLEPRNHFPFEIAVANFNLARVALKEGDIDTVRRHAQKADNLFKQFQVGPQLQGEITQLLASI